jgi:NAD(P)-dependent dehydrogenase (short-subunit alcohol dehydrogenase family)
VVAKTVLITGSSSGIGRMTVQRFAAGGWNVAATARDPAVLAALAGPTVALLRLDVTDEASIAAGVSAAVERFGGIDVLVNSAGFGVFGPLEALTADEWQTQFRTNVFGTVAMIRHVLPIMRSRGGGTIVNMSSLGGRFASPFGSAYFSSKFAIEGLSESLRFELKPHGIHVKLIEPTHFKTGFVTRSLRCARHGAYEPQMSNMMAMMAYGDERAPTPEPVADAIFKAATDASGRLRYPVKGGLVRLVHALLPDALWRAMLSAGRNRRPPARGSKESAPAKG